MKTIIISFVMFLCACASTNKQEIFDINAPVDPRGKLGKSVIGLNEKNEGVIQEEILVEDELRQQELLNSSLHDTVLSEQATLEGCREDLTDKRLGGTGEMSPLPEIDNLRLDEKVTEKMGADSESGELKIVRTTFLRDKITNEKRYNKSLITTLDTLKKANKECGKKLAEARRKAGLQGTRYMPDGYFTSNGTWVQQKQGEVTLDDAFRIKAEMEAKHQKPDASKTVIETTKVETKEDQWIKPRWNEND